MQRRLRVRAGDDGELGVLRQHDAALGPPARRRPARREPGDPDPGSGAAGHLARGGPHPGRLQRRPGHRRPGRGTGRPGRPQDRQGARLDRAGAGAGGRPKRATKRRSRGDRHPDPGADRALGPARHLHPRRVPAGGRLAGAAEGARHAARRGHRDREGLRAARPRRGRLPDRREVGLPPAGRRQAALPGGQRGRIRTGRLQGRPADDGHPAHAHRGRGHRLLRDRGQPRVHLRPGRGPARHPAAAARRAGGVRGRATSAGTSSAPGSTWTSSSTPGPAPTSAARRPRCWTRWRASAGCRGTSRRSRPWPACTPSRRT